MLQAILPYIPQIMQFAPLVVSGAQHFWAWIIALRKAAQQTGEWTPEMEAAFVTGLIATINDRAYLPDAALPQPAPAPNPGSVTINFPTPPAPPAPATP